MPGVIHPRNLTLTVCDEEDHLLVGALLGECSDTLESLNIRYDVFRMSIRYLHPYQ